MKFFLVVAICLAGTYAAPNYGGYSDTPQIRITSHEAPALKFTAPAYAEVLPSRAYAEVKSYAPLVEVKKPIVPIVRFNLNDDNYGTFNFDSLSGDGTQISEQGNLKNLGDLEGPVSVMSGSYSFLGDDGKTYTVTWTADENGFRAQGAHLPTPPPVPEEILKTLSTLSSSSSFDDGQYHEAPFHKVATASYGYSAPVTTLRKSVDSQTFDAPNIRIISN